MIGALELNVSGTFFGPLNVLDPNPAKEAQAETPKRLHPTFLRFWIGTLAAIFPRKSSFIRWRYWIAS